MKILIDENNAIKAWQIVGNGWVDTEYKTVDVEEIPEEVKANCEKYCYIDGLFVENPNYIDNQINTIKSNKIQSLSTTCSNIIYQGIDVTLSDNSIQHFTLTERDQLNLSGIGLKLLMGSQQIAWHEDDETKECQYYSAQDAQLIIGTLTTFKEYHITYFRDLRIYVNSLQTVEEVNAIEYGFALPEEFKSQVLKDLEQMLGM